LIFLFADLFNVGAQGAEFFVKLFRAALNVGNVFHDGLALGDQRRQGERGAGADVGSVHGGAGQFGFAEDQRAVRIGDFNVGAHFAQFFKVAQAIFIERFADQSLSGGLGEQVQTTGVEPL